MKRLFLALALTLGLCSMARAGEATFAYEAGLEVVSAYIYRGQYNGGLSAQPYVSIGYETEHTSLSIGAWASLGASDWKFTDKTCFIPEFDLSLNFSCYGLNLYATHFYYCDGSDYLSWQTPEEIVANGNTSQTEIGIGYNFGDLLDVPVYINWYTMIAGCDILPTATGWKRAYSSYLEVGYDHEFDYGWTLGGQIGMSPWASCTLGNEKFAVVCLGLKLNKEWEVGVCTFDLFAQGTLNPDGINKDNVYINAAGEDKLYQQKLNGVIGLGIWF